MNEKDVRRLARDEIQRFVDQCGATHFPADGSRGVIVIGTDEYLDWKIFKESEDVAQ